MATVGGAAGAELGCAVSCVAVVVTVESEQNAWAIFTAVVAVETEDAEVGSGVDVVTVKLAAGGGVTVAGVDVVGGKAGVCGQFFAAVVVTVFTVVVAAGVTLTASDTRVVVVVVVVAGATVGTALTAAGGGAATGAATVVAESGTVASTVVQVEGFVSTGAVGTISVCFECGRVAEAMLAGGRVVVVPVTGTLVDEDAEETWVDAVWELGTAADRDVEAARGRGVVTWGAGAAGTGTEAETGVEA